MWVKWRLLDCSHAYKYQLFLFLSPFSSLSLFFSHFLFSFTLLSSLSLSLSLQSLTFSKGILTSEKCSQLNVFKYIKYMSLKLCLETATLLLFACNKEVNNFIHPCGNIHYTVKINLYQGTFYFSKACCY